ncbi:TetR/AcrR family transcriptional regulator [Amycolatopsis sp.]|uniref:TetR/AcrR family transcriptional regulator n=1 Tax=Amycolatopsis sp. TaxID=37632 RepID=UPI002BCC4FC7|nr:TetR/AcrR family transcriptional regulator [Amycolatopsis sp.]HVV08105.1 TetR/AcrR family transcriptional regulator [Amycolatopsis sp.]
MSGPSPIGRPLGADGEHTRRRIMEAAMADVADAGYAHATMKSIAERAGLTSAAIYHYFRSKQELVLAVLTASVDEVVARLDEATHPEGTLRQRFTALLDEALAIVKDHPALTRFVATVYLESGKRPEFTPVLNAGREAEEKIYLRLIDEAVRAGELADGVDRDGLVDTFTSLTWGLRYLSATAAPERHRAAIDTVGALVSGTLFRAP